MSRALGSLTELLHVDRDGLVLFAQQGMNAPIVTAARKVLVSFDFEDILEGAIVSEEMRAEELSTQKGITTSERAAAKAMSSARLDMLQNRTFRLFFKSMLEDVLAR